MGLRAVYTPQFKQFVRQNPGILKNFAQAYRQGADTYESCGVRIRKFDPGAEPELEGKAARNGQMHYRLWTVECSGRKLFVKESLRTEEAEAWDFTGIRQYRLTRKLDGFARLLSKFWKHDIEVLQPHFGATYWDTSFIVMDFCSHPQASKSAVPEGLRRQHWIFSHLARLFAGIWDICLENAFYDDKNGKLILYDPGRDTNPFPIRAAIYAYKAVKKAVLALWGDAGRPGCPGKEG